MRRALWLPALAAAAVIVTVAPASAHGVGVRGDLPLPFYQFAWAAAAALVASFAGLGILWNRPMLANAAAGKPVPQVIDRLARGLALPGRVIAAAVLVLTIVAGVAGTNDIAENIAPTTVYVIFWVGVVVAAAILGDFWRAVSPFETAADIVERLRQRGDASEIPGAARSLAHVTAIVPLSVFLWLELAYHKGSDPRTVGWATLAYTVGILAGTWKWGRPWMRDAEGFGVLLTLVASMAPLYRDDAGRLRVRLPFAGTSTIPFKAGTTALVLVVLGGTTFDGFSGSEVWSDWIGTRTGWESTSINTLGLVATIAVIGGLYVVASHAAANVVGSSASTIAREFGHSLIPIVLGYAVAHYFSLLVIEGQQRFRILLSDPLGRGWDLFGTAGDSIDFLIVSAGTIAWVQALAIVVGHVAGVTVAHDRAIERFGARDAVASQYPMLGAMVAYSVLGLWLLLSA